jgi:hypothetical protein
VQRAACFVLRGFSVTAFNPMPLSRRHVDSWSPNHPPRSSFQTHTCGEKPATWRVEGPWHAGVSWMSWLLLEEYGVVVEEAARVHIHPGKQRRRSGARLHAGSRRTGRIHETGDGTSAEGHECGNAGLQDCRSAGVGECRSAGLQELGSAEVQGRNGVSEKGAHRARARVVAVGTGTDESGRGRGVLEWDSDAPSRIWPDRCRGPSRRSALGMGRSMPIRRGIERELASDHPRHECCSGVRWKRSFARHMHPVLSVQRSRRSGSSSQYLLAHRQGRLNVGGIGSVTQKQIIAAQVPPCGAERICVFRGSSERWELCGQRRVSS